MESLIGDERDFCIYYKKNGKRYPYYCVGWEDEYDAGNNMEKSVLYIHHLTKMSDEYKSNNSSNIVTIPFEKFVLSPEEGMSQIETLLNLKRDERTEAMLLKQKVPRQKTVQGLDLEIYRRCGWTPGESELTERDELNLRYEFAVKELGPKFKEMLDASIEKYEKEVWIP